MYKCEKCNLEFETFQEKANHHRWKHLKYAFKNEETKHKCIETAIKREEIKAGAKFIELDIKCVRKTCNNVIHIRCRENDIPQKQFCSIGCANNVRIRTKESKLKSSISVKRAWREGKYNTNSYYEKQSKNKKFTSKVEREIVNYFKINYPQYEWKSGGNLKYKENGLGRDLYSNILKICFEYDGIWHFKNINRQLEKKQLKDKLLEEWCLENNYRLIRIDEKDYINFEQIEKLFFENIDPIIKIGKRY